jgi:RND family efflux transporter MFP subunit
MPYQIFLPLAAIGVLVQALLQAASAYGEALDCLIEPYVVVNVSSAVSGLLETVTVDRGDLVKQGQVLATLESDVEKASIDVYRARATLESPIRANQARLELSTRRHARDEGMFQRALIPADKMDETETTKRLAELSLLEATDARRLAELELQRATAELTRRTIRSPITGMVVERFRHPGEFANEEPILKLAQLDPLRVEVFVPVARLGELAVSMRAEVRPQEPVGGVYTARVTVVDRVVDAASGMFGVRLEIPNKGYRLPAGLKCQVRFLRE